MNKALLILCISNLLSACSVFPDYVKPDFITPERWYAKTDDLSRTPVSVDWWQQFNDPILLKLQQFAETGYPSLDKALAGIESARASLKSADASGIPILTGSGSYNRSKGGSSGVGGTTSNSMGMFTTGITEILSGSVSASWEIDLFGKIRFNQTAEQARLEAEQYLWHDTRISLAAEVASDYISFRACELKSAALQQTVISKQENARLTQMLAQSGFSTPADAALAEASLQSSDSNLLAQHAECDKTIKALVALTNLQEPEIRSMLAEGQGIPQPAQFSVISVPADLLRQRPDLAAAERKLAGASADIGNAVAKRYPSLTLTGSIGKRKTDASGITLSSNTWSIGPSITLPIFDGGELSAKVDNARASYHSNFAELRQKALNAAKEVEQALVDLDSAEQREIRERISAERYTDYFKAAQTHWRHGGISLLSLEDARSQMINQQISYITQQQNRVQYWIALYKALGGGWSTTSDSPATTVALDKEPK